MNGRHGIHECPSSALTLPGVHPPISHCLSCMIIRSTYFRYGDASITVKSARFGSMLYAFNGDESTVKTGLKIVLEGPTERVVGLHCIGPSSDEMLQGFAVAIRMGECLFYWGGTTTAT